MNTLHGKCAIITGAGQGLGFEIAKQFIGAGINGIAICARNDDTLNTTTQKLMSFTKSGQKVLAVRADIGNSEEAELFCQKAIAEFGNIHILVNNAGIYGPKGRIEDIDWEKWTDAVRINLYGSILMCRFLLPHFRSQVSGKIIQISGGGATNPMPFLTAYAAGKAGIVRFMESLAEEVADAGITVNCIAPGLLNTRLLDEILEAGPKKVGQKFYDRMFVAKSAGKTTPLALGAELAVFLASDVSAGISGRLISAQWDNWRVWPQHIEELKKTDAYTLRRIVGRDRGMVWGDK